jgi:two-component system nitrogen regulation response regulator GlnG
LTVTAPGREICALDLPPELGGNSTASQGIDWAGGLAQWAARALEKGDTELLARALPAFETALINAALAATGGKRQEAAKLLGWGRNTLTRKIRDLGLDENPEN